MAPHRRILKEYVLGPDRPTSLERFNAAVNALADRAARETAERGTEGQPLLGRALREAGPSAERDETRPDDPMPRATCRHDERGVSTAPRLRIRRGQARRGGSGPDGARRPAQRTIR